jgi:hypothetical protein
MDNRPSTNGGNRESAVNELQTGLAFAVSEHPGEQS